jgi:hypothetical protein
MGIVHEHSLFLICSSHLVYLHVFGADFRRWRCIIEDLCYLFETSYMATIWRNIRNIIILLSAIWLALPCLTFRNKLTSKQFGHAKPHRTYFTFSVQEDIAGFYLLPSVSLVVFWIIYTVEVCNFKKRKWDCQKLKRQYIILVHGLNLYLLLLSGLLLSSTTAVVSLILFTHTFATTSH